MIKPLRINIIGCMGVGKSTICKLIAERTGIMIIEEQFENNPYWKEVYATGKADCLKMQIDFMNQYMENFMLLQDNKDMSIVMDNQFLAGLPFVLSQYKSGMISDVDKMVYEKRFKLLVGMFSSVLKTTHHFILIDDPESIVNKIKSRNRNAERNISIEFIKDLLHYFVYLKDWCYSSFGINITLVNVKDLPKTAIPSKITEIIPCRNRVSLV